MKINLNTLSRYNNQVLKEDIVFPKDMLQDINSLIDVKTCNVEVQVCDYGDIVRVLVQLKATVVLQCAYTLEPIDYIVDTDEYIDFSMLDEDEEDDNIFYVDNPEDERGKWRKLYKNPTLPLYLELGCGKGYFIEIEKNGKE